jgi:PAS domain S-box-containing protein
MRPLQASSNALAILIVEDDQTAAESLQTTLALKYPDFTILTGGNGRQGLDMYRQWRPDIVISDINMPEMNGIQMAAGIKEINPSARIIAATAMSDTVYLVDAVRIGITRYMLKPIEFSALFQSIEECIADIARERQIHAQNESINKLSQVIEQSTDLVLITDTDGIIEYANPKFFETTGYGDGDLATLDFRQLVTQANPKQIRLAIEQALQDAVPLRGEIISRRRNGTEFFAEISLSPLQGATGKRQMVAVMQDVSARKKSEEEHRRLEEQMLHAQKLESLGVLAGGIAHDFNNILMAIIGNADLALMRINKESPAVENLRQIEKASARAADLAKQMLAYSGKGKFVVENLDLNLLLEDMLHMLEVSISKKAVLRLNLTQALPTVEVDATQLRQIVMNLVINASEAIGEKSGVIAISTGCMDCDRNYLQNVWLSENLGEGMYVYLEVADTGSGMTRETMNRIFDPFFTTKFSGRGLGMAAVLGIVKGHKGAIRIYSEPGKGTTLKVLLPASSRPLEMFHQEASDDSWQGGGSVLLVDDEETVRAIGSEMLKELGFLTITAVDGREALRIYQQVPHIDFVILDLTMPHLDGEQCYRELRQINPEVKVIMTSGYNEHEVTQKFAGKGLAGFMQKPYNINELKRMIIDLELNKPT